ncbi:MAG: hypothetical protein ABI833_18685 [Acidobacteriota bacterium]
MKFQIASLLLVLPLVASAQGDKPIIDNNRVTVWDVTWTKDQPSPNAAGDRDAVTVYISGGDFKITKPDGKSSMVARKTGAAIFRPKGVRASETWVGTGTPPHTTEIALKDSDERPAPNTSGNPLAFPRPGATNLIDNHRVFVWDNRWTPGVPTSMHFHDKDVVVTYLEEGDLTSITPDGKSVVNPYKPGQIRFSVGNRSHKEVVSKGTQRAIIVELK